MLNVSKLKKGIVIDHIDAGKGFDIYRELHLNEIEDPVVLMKGLPSTKLGKKDMIKIETDLELDMQVLGLIDPNVTINYVEDGMLKEKKKLTLPEKVTGILKCKNPRCITQHEQTGPIDFYLVDAGTKTYRCEYCDAYTTFHSH